MLGLIADTLYLVPVSTSGSAERAETERGKEVFVHPELYPQVTFPISRGSVISTR